MFLNELASIIPLAAIVAFAACLYGLVTYAMKRNDDNAKKKAKSFIIGGGLGLVALLVLWGFVGYSQQSVGLSGSVSLSAPTMGIAPSYDSTSSNYGERGMVYRDEMSVTKSSIAPMPPIPGPDGAPAGEAKVIKNASLALLVRNVDDAAVEINLIRARFDGQIGNSTFNEYTAGSRVGEITIWVPSARFDEALIEVKKLALRVNNESISVSDVSAQFVDLDARLKNLRATEEQYKEILKRSGKLSDVLDVTRELSNTRSQIEQLEGQRNYLSRQVALSSIRISLSQEAAPSDLSDEWRPLATLKAAAKETLSGFTDFIDMVLVLLVALPLLLLKLGFFGLILFVLWRGWRFALAKWKSTTLPGQ